MGRFLQILRIWSASSHGRKAKTFAICHFFDMALIRCSSIGGLAEIGINPCSLLLMITHESTFYNHRDDQSPLAADPVLQGPNDRRCQMLGDCKRGCFGRGAADP